jgi:hypothetical protein
MRQLRNRLFLASCGRSTSWDEARLRLSRRPPTEVVVDVADAVLFEDVIRTSSGARREAELLPVPGAATALEAWRGSGHRLHLRVPAGERQRYAAALKGHGLLGHDDVVMEQQPFVQGSDSAGPRGWSVGTAARSSSWGIRRLVVRGARPAYLEVEMSREGDPLCAAVAGAARRARLAAQVQTDHERALVEAGTGLAGQSLAAFLLWVAEQCEQDGVEQVAFLARDGELPLQMARAMPADHWQGRELSYLHGSRRLWSLAAAWTLGVDAWLAEGTGDEGSFVLQNQHAIPLRSLLSRVGLTVDDVADVGGLQALDPAAPLPRSAAQAWRAVLHDGPTRRRISARAQRQHELLVDYLQASGIQARRTALVDVGWRGQVAWQISAVLREITGVEPIHLHFGGANVVVGGHRARIRRFAVDDSREPLPFPDVVSCVETFTASGRPRATTLVAGPDGRARPEFAPAIPALDNDARRLIWRSATDAARALPSRTALGPDAHDKAALAPGVRRLLTTFWTRPLRQDAVAGSLLAAEVDDTGVDVRPVAVAYSVTELLPGRAARRTWREGSLRLTRQPLRSALRLAMAMSARRSRPAGPS